MCLGHDLFGCSEGLTGFLLQHAGARGAALIDGLGGLRRTPAPLLPDAGPRFGPAQL